MLWAVLVLVLAVVGGLVVLVLFSWRLFKQLKSLGGKLAVASAQLAEVSETLAAAQPESARRTNNR